MSNGVHLVGSVPLASASAVFSTACHHLEGLISRVPDGETGERTNWIGWQLPKLAASPGLAVREESEHDYGTPGQIYTTGPIDQVRLDNLGYRDAALASYAEFKALKERGEIPADIRFQVCLPTPLAPMHLYVDAKDRAGLEPIYESAMLAELRDIAAEIPHGELAVQWDTAVEFGVIEGVFPTYIEDAHAGIVQRLIRLGEGVPAAVELGYHLCYGDAGHKHFVEPTDMSKLVDVANDVVAGLARNINWIHMPVPRERSDTEYFAPLTDLDIDSSTELYLGLVHMTDGLDGAQARVDAARAVVSSFGVATECGFGRRPPETIAPLLEMHKVLAEGMA